MFQDIIGKTDVEIFKGGGVKESQDFKREVLEKGLPGKREITFETELFGDKTFLIYVEPVFNKAGETIGVNYMGMEITDQVRVRLSHIFLKVAIRPITYERVNFGCGLSLMGQMSLKKIVVEKKKQVKWVNSLPQCFLSTYNSLNSIF